MTTHSTERELVEQLRRYMATVIAGDIIVPPICEEAAAHIEELEARVVVLESALRLYEAHPNEFQYCTRQFDLVRRGIPGCECTTEGCEPVRKALSTSPSCANTKEDSGKEGSS